MSPQFHHEASDGADSSADGHGIGEARIFSQVSAFIFRRVNLASFRSTGDALVLDDQLACCERTLTYALGFA